MMKRMVAVTFVLLWAATPPAFAEGITRADVGAWLESSTGATPDFAPGDVISAETHEKVRPFVVPGHFEEQQFPEFRMAIAESGDYSPHEVYQQASLEYGAQCEIGEDGVLENYVAGQPFANERVDAAPPEQAGFMAAWNSNHRWQHYGQHVIRAQTLFLREGKGGESFSDFPEHMIRGGGELERSVEVGWRRTYHTHLAQLAESEFRFPFSGAENATYKELTEYYAPFEFRGQKLMVERPVDPHEDDTINAYLPTERKVRRLSAKEKSDTWLGSEITFDDFYGFDGHVLDNTWRYLGRHKLLVVMDSKHEYPRHYGPQSRISDDHWELREAIVVEGIPTLKNHPYSSRLLFLDAQNYSFISGLYFDPEGRLMRGAFPVYSWSESGGEEGESIGARVSMYRGYAFINFQTGNTTLTNVLKTTYPEPKAAEVRRYYGVDNLSAGR